VEWVVVMAINWREIYPNELDAELCEGYYDGKRVASPEPGPNRHPAYIHGFRNGRDDSNITKRHENAQQRREIWEYIVATCD